MGKYVVKMGDGYYEFDSYEEYQTYMHKKWLLESLEKAAEQEKKDKEKAAKKAQAAKEEAERQKNIKLAEESRVRTLKEFCLENHLDFDSENRKYVKKKAAQNTFGGIVLTFGIIAILFSIVTFTGWELFDKFSLSTWLIPGVAGIVVSLIGYSIIPKVPDGFYDQIKKK